MQKTILKTLFITGFVLSLASNVQAMDTYGMSEKEIHKMRAKIDRQEEKDKQDQRINKKIEPKVEKYRNEQYKKELAKEHQRDGKK